LHFEEDGEGEGGDDKGGESEGEGEGKGKGEGEGGGETVEDVVECPSSQRIVVVWCGPSASAVRGW